MHRFDKLKTLIPLYSNNADIALGTASKLCESCQHFAPFEYVSCVLCHPISVSTQMTNKTWMKTCHQIQVFAAKSWYHPKLDNLLRTTPSQSRGHAILHYINNICFVYWRICNTIWHGNDFMHVKNISIVLNA